MSKDKAKNSNSKFIGEKALAELKSDLEKSTPKTPFIVISITNEYAVIFAASKNKAEFIGENDFGFNLPVAAAFEDMDDFKKIKSMIRRLKTMENKEETN